MAADLFSNQISNRNFLSPIGFKFTLAKEPKVAFFCNSAKIPDLSFQVLEQETYLKNLDVPGGLLEYGDLILRFLVDEDLVNYMAIHNWLTGLGFPETTQQYRDLISDPNDSTQPRDPKRAFSDGSLYILDSNYNTNSIVKFKDLFPYSLTSLEFDATKTDIQYFTAEVKFKYTIYNIIQNQNDSLRTFKKPTIILSSSNTTPSIGDEITLSWTARGASSITINNGIGVVEGETGSINVTVNESIIYTATVRGLGGTSTSSVTINPIYPLPTITLSAPTSSTSLLFSDDFESNPTGLNLIPTGWTVENGTVDIVTMSSVTNYPEVYAGKVIDLDGTIGDAGLLSITRTLEFGKSYRLVFDIAGNWRNSQTDRIQVGFGTTSEFDIPYNQLFESKELLFSPTVTNDYKISFKNTGGSGDDRGPFLDNVRIYVTSPVAISLGSTIPLSWVATDATNVTIDNGIGVVNNVSGSTNVVINSGITYTATATGLGGTSTSSVTIYPQPTITLSASTTSPSPGNTVTLSWEALNSTSITINNGIGVVSNVSGSISFVYDEDITYTAIATGPGGTTTSSITVARPIQTSFNRTCIAVIDENDNSGPSIMEQRWVQFRQQWPNRRFFLLNPYGGAVANLNTTIDALNVPPSFLEETDPISAGTTST